MESEDPSSDSDTESEDEVREGHISLQVFKKARDDFTVKKIFRLIVRK